MSLEWKFLMMTIDFLNKNLEPSKRYGLKIAFDILFKQNMWINNSFAFTKAKMRSGD